VSRPAHRERDPIISTRFGGFSFSARVTPAVQFHVTELLSISSSEGVHAEVSVERARAATKWINQPC
jgi:hypothetical protein